MSKNNKKKAVPARRPRAVTATPLSLAGKVRWVLLLALLATVLSATALMVWRDYQRFVDQPLAVNNPQTVVTLQAGQGLTQLHANLAAAGVDVGPLWRWRVLARQLDVERSLKPGEYALNRRLTPTDTLRAVVDGKVVLYRFRIEPGRRFAEFRARIEADPVLVQTLGQASDADILAAIGAAETHPEGLFLPETYFFARGYTDLELYKRAYWALKEALDREFEERAPDLPLRDPYEALILASIIEKETGRAFERPIIAGVFRRRLEIGMRLQTDPTVIYGIGDAYDGNIRKRDLLTDTPYNTYTRGGLTPTPIALPSLAAIQAALNPADGDALYFVSKGDGTHQFSATLAEHNAAVRRYQLGLP